jgi:S-adenosylmethionine:tRNA ribosyltransferase-isomerase
MLTEELNYYLPQELIAQKPSEVRSDSRLLVLRRQHDELIDSSFDKIGVFLKPGDCLVLNDTKVLPARFFARRTSGGKLEGLFLSHKESGIWEVMLKGASKVKNGDTIFLINRDKQDFCKARAIENLGEGRFYLGIDADAEDILEKIGFPPLPPYIKRTNTEAEAIEDKIRYQTVYANQAGAIAAPTAGLHFTEELISHLKNKGITFAYLTLHVGAGTFKPVTAENLEEHQIHEERFSINGENACIINDTKAKGGRIIAVGTTSVRTLEAAASGTEVKAMSGETKLFITPGYKFKIVDGMITNFHLPKSTLLALVAALAGLDKVMAAYRHAVENKYRFYSYGDAMLII